MLKKSGINSILLFCLLAALSGCGDSRDKQESPASKTPLHGVFLAMGGVPVEITLYNTSSDAESVIDACSGEVRRLEMILSRHIPDSEISKINRSAPGTEISISPEMREVLTAAGRVHAMTGGRFDPTVTPLIELWKKAGKDGRLPAEETVKTVLEHVGFENVEIGESTLVLKNGVKIDLGGIAKGFIVDKLVSLLKKRGETAGIVNAGGDLRVFGEKKGGFVVGITDPFVERTVTPALIKKAVITSGAFVTSGSYERFSIIEGKRYSHIIDPVTGYPVDNTLASVSVTHADAMIADALATGIFVLGFSEGGKLIKNLDEAGAFLLSTDRSEFADRIDVK